MNHATAICPCSDCTKARKWKATAYVMRHRGALLRVVMYTPRWWQFKCDGVECAMQYGSAKSAMRAAERYVDDMRKVKR